MTAEKLYPVYETLETIGIASIPSLLDRLKQVDPDDIPGRGQIEHNLLVSLLVKIYAQGGFGPEIARQRIELELKKATGREKKFLQKALDRFATK